MSERSREIRRRRQRRKKMIIIRRRAEKASASEKVVLAQKVRQLTPGCEIIIERLGLEGS